MVATMPRRDRPLPLRKFELLYSGTLSNLTLINSDDANFINFCQGADLTNGEQKEGGSCNGIGKSHISPRQIFLQSFRQLANEHQ